MVQSGKRGMVKVYCTLDNLVRRKKTAHYQTWHDTVAKMMAEPCSSVKYTNIFPNNPGWG